MTSQQHEYSAEIERSRAEAKSREGESLIFGPRERARYSHPPAATPYPLEYAYHLLQADMVSGQHIADLGCGAGENSAMLALLGYRVTGIDISADMTITHFKEFSLPHIKLFHGRLAYRLDRWLLDHLPLRRYARIRVFRFVRS